MKNYLLSFFALFAAIALLPRASLLFPPEEQVLLTVLDHKSGETVPIPLEDYVIGVLERISPGGGQEFMKAVAVAVRSSALYCEQYRPVHQKAAVCNDPLCCRGFETEGFSEDSVAAAAETAGRILTYEGQPAAAVFHESWGNYTASYQSVYGREIPYLIRVKNTEEPLISETRVTEESFRALLKIPSEAETESLFWAYDASGRLVSLEWGQDSLSGNRVAELLELPSLCITAKNTEGVFHITCMGKGDGVGMSLRGASLLAQEGKTFEAILAHYFPGTVLTT